MVPLLGAEARRALALEGTGKRKDGKNAVVDAIAELLSLSLSLDRRGAGERRKCSRVEDDEVF